MEGVDSEFEVGEGGGEGGVEDGGGRRGGGDEMEKDVFGAGRVLEDGENGSHGATEVGDVQAHCHVDCLVGAHRGALRGVVELWGFFEALSRGGDHNHGGENDKNREHNTQR